MKTKKTGGKPVRRETEQRARQSGKPQGHGAVHLLAHWDAIHTDWEANVTRIRGRRLFHRIWDVVAHSVLKFDFQGVPVTRGWVEGIIAGDTKCGKSEVAEKMTAFLGLAKPIICESASYAGVVGGAKEVGGRWMIGWGALPRLDRMMAVLDEVTGLTVEQIGQMSGLRSSGIASLVKIEAEKAKARVRKLWISNPRSDRNRRVTTYPFGCLVLPEIIGRAEDISRFDIALVASAEEVPLEILNLKKLPQVKHVYTAEAAKALIYWAWTRSPEQVKWMPGTEDMVLDVAMEQCRTYSSSIPLVEPGEQRFRVARIAVALAARFHSSDPTGQHVRVFPAHVQLAAQFMADCFDSPVTGYRLFSATKMGGTAALATAEMDALKAALERFPNVDVALDAIAFSDDLNRLLVLEHNKQAGLLAELTRLQLLEYGDGGNLNKTKKFNEVYRAVRGNIKPVSSTERF